MGNGYEAFLAVCSSAGFVLLFPHPNCSQVLCRQREFAPRAVKGSLSCGSALRFGCLEWLTSGRRFPAWLAISALTSRVLRIVCVELARVRLPHPARPVDASAVAEKKFHGWLRDADHPGSRAQRGGSEWFVTSTTFLDRVADSLGLKIQLVNDFDAGTEQHARESSQLDALRHVHIRYVTYLLKREESCPLTPPMLSLGRSSTSRFQMNTSQLCSPTLAIC